MRHIDLARLSVEALEALSKKALEGAEDLKREQPSLALALANGVKDISYSTVRWGGVTSYTGQALVTMEDGTSWRCIGHRPTGSSERIDRQGWVEFVKCESDSHFTKRCEERTGMPFEAIPEGDEKDVIGGHLFLRRTTHEGHQEYILGVGYPETTPEGDEVYDHFVRVVLT